MSGLSLAKTLPAASAISRPESEQSSSMISLLLHLLRLLPFVVGGL
jgi:hypothetical protein